MKHFLTLLMLIAFVTFFTAQAFAGWLIFHKPAYKGKVIDAETKEPIEGAVVVAMYYKHPIISGPGGGSASIIHIKEVLTDEKGEFYIPSYTTIIGPNSVEAFAAFIIYKPGYVAYPSCFPAYGDFPDYRASPLKHMSLPAIERFFWEESFLKQEEMILSFGPLKKGYGTYGLVELPRLSTEEERLRAVPSTPTDTIKDTPLLYRAINEEGKRFGLRPVGR